MIDSSIIGAIIVGVCTIAAAVIYGILVRPDIFEYYWHKREFRNLRGTWESTWVNFDEKDGTKYRESLVITHQAGSRIYGRITMEGDEWIFEGRVSERFLQLFYYPSREVVPDYGVYFFEIQQDGSYEGYSVSREYGIQGFVYSKHELRKID